MSEEVNVSTELSDTSVFEQPTDYSKSMKYYSQLPKEITEDADTMESVKDCATIADLVKSLKESRKSLSESKIDESKYIKFPSEDSTLEEKASFLRKLGVPTSKTAYKLNIAEDEGDNIKELGNKFSEIFYGAALTNTQAQRVFKSIAEAFVEGSKKQEEAQKEYFDSFDKRQTEYLKTLTKVDDEVKAFKERDLSLTNVFMNDTNLGEELKKSGLLLDPVVLHKIAEYQSQRQPKASFSEGSPDSKGGFEYSSEFQRIYGVKK